MYFPSDCTCISLTVVKAVVFIAFSAFKSATGSKIELEPPLTVLYSPSSARYLEPPPVVVITPTLAFSVAEYCLYVVPSPYYIFFR